MIIEILHLWEGLARYQQGIPFGGVFVGMAPALFMSSLKHTFHFVANMVTVMSSLETVFCVFGLFSVLIYELAYSLSVVVEKLTKLSHVHSLLSSGWEPTSNVCSATVR